MGSRIPRLRRRPARIPYTPGRSRSFGEERHEFRLGPRLPEARADAFEAEQDVELPPSYRDFLMYMGGSGASPYYGTDPLTGRVPTGNADGFWGPNVSSAPDFLAWYERRLDHMAAGRDERALQLTSPRLHARTHHYRPASRT
ncbi:SMI1/KNR4 family protein [Streptomyces litmocidini]|uniref:SMI1/KNR4 family protein n=1 Tax=Streptomyces litmocidini TaxID=67318 RepID=UPI0036F5A6DF